MRSTAQWRLRAREDAMYAAASHAGTENRGWDREAFYALGRSDWEDFAPRWAQYAGGIAGTCLEIGCGPGRLTAPLTQAFEDVIAVDVSDEMISLAKAVAPSATFHQVSATALPLETASVDAVFTCHVLQHFERQQEVEHSLQESLRVLRPGGTVMIHLLLLRSWSEFAADWKDRVRNELGRRVRPQQAHTTVRRYSTGVARDMFDAAGFRDVELREFRLQSNGDPHGFWFGRKP